MICDGCSGTPFSGLLPRHLYSDSYSSGIDAATALDLVPVVVVPLILAFLPCDLSLVFGDSTSASDIPAPDREGCLQAVAKESVKHRFFSSTGQR